MSVMLNRGMAKTSFSDAYQETPWRPFSGNKEVHSWPLLNTLFSQNAFSYADYILIQRLLSPYIEVEQEVALFLLYLILAAKNGHVCVHVSKDGCEPIISDLLQIQESTDYFSLLVIAIQKGSEMIPKNLIAEATESDQVLIISKPIYRNGNYFYLQKAFYFETLLLRNLVLHLERPLQYSFSAMIKSEVLKKIEKKILLQAQGEAIINSLSHPLTLVTGGPGTGKTYTVGHLIRTILENIAIEDRKHFQIVLAAPTGKAVARLQSSLGDISSLCEDFPPIQSKTLHALLGIKENAVHSEKIRLSADMLVVDESSMIDLRMMAYLFEALKPGSRVLFLGDQNQLPSVEMGNVFIDLLGLKDEHGHRLIPSAFLTDCVRTEIASLIQFAQLVNRGSAAEVIDFLKNADGSGIRLRNLCEKDKRQRKNLLEEVVSQFPKVLQEGGDEEERILANFQKFRPLSPVRKGLYGVDTWNELIWERVKCSLPASGWGVIPIIITVNDYEVELFNGETGILVRRLPLGVRYGVDDYAFFPSKEKGQIRRISALLLPRHELAYCLSVHKSQGSEFDAIVLLLPEGEGIGRELFYTAVTRARKSIEVVGSEEVVARVVQQKQSRVSGFSVRFKKAIGDTQNLELHALEK